METTMWNEKRSKQFSFVHKCSIVNLSRFVFSVVIMVKMNWFTQVIRWKTPLVTLPVLFYVPINVQSVAQQVHKVIFLVHILCIKHSHPIQIAHTIKYCQAAGDDNNRHVATPYEKMIRTQCIQTFGLDENLATSIPTIFGPIGSNSPSGSPASLWPAMANGWSGSNL